MFWERKRQVGNPSERRAPRKTHCKRASRLRALQLESLETRNLMAIVWSTGSDLPIARYDAAAVLGADDAVYLLGGNSLNVNVQPAGASNWNAGDPIKQEQMGLGAGAITDGRIAHFGGQKRGQAIEETFLYDPVNGDPQDGDVMATPRAFGAYATDPNTGKIYAIGGVDDNSVVLGATEVYDPATDTWTTLAPLPSPRADFAAAADGAGSIFTFGGRQGSNGVTNNVYRYNIATNVWTAVAPLPVALRDVTAVTGPSDGKIYVIGGRDAAGPVASVYAYNFVSNTWEVETSLPVAVADAAAVLDAEGHLMLLGGRNVLGQAVASVLISQDLDAAASAPVFASTPVTIAVSTVPYSYQVAATGNPQASFALVAAPSGMSIDASGLIRWTPNESHVGTQVVSLRASNLAGSVDQTYAIAVATALPIITTTPSMTGSTGMAYVYDVSSTGAPLPTYSLTTAPAGMTINASSGVISWTPTVEQAGAHSVTVVAENLHGSDAQTYTIDVVDNTLPTSPTSLAVTGVTLTSVSLSWAPSTDNVGVEKYQVREQYKYGWRNSRTGYRVIQDNILSTSTTVTGLVSGKAYNLVVTAVDATGNISLNSNLVNTRALQLPSITHSGDKLVVATHAMVDIGTYASGVPAPTISLVSGPAGLVFDPTTRIAKWTPADAQVGAHTVTFRATNSQGTANVTALITVAANLPVPTSSFTYFGAAHSVPFAVEGDSFDLKLSETFSNSLISWSVVSGPSGLTVNPTTGIVSWIPNATEVGTQNIVLRATNYAGSKDLEWSVVVHPLGTDLRPPLPVSGITVNVIDSTRASVTWSPTTDNIGVESYRITSSYRYQAGRVKRTVTRVFTAQANETMLEMSGLSTRAQELYIQAIDAAGNVSPVGQVVSFTPVSNPLFPQVQLADSVQLQNVVVGVNRTIQVTDTNSSPRTFTMLTAPTGAIINAATGLISWTPTYADVGTATITVRATNASGYRDLTFAFPVSFTGPVQNVAYVRTSGSTASATWEPPTDVSNVAGYMVYQTWSISGHTYSRSYKVDGAMTNRLDTIYLVGGPVIHKIRVVAIDALGRQGLSTSLSTVLA